VRQKNQQTSGAEARAFVGLQRHGWKPCPSRIIYKTTSQHTQQSTAGTALGATMGPATSGAWSARRRVLSLIHMATILSLTGARFSVCYIATSATETGAVPAECRVLNAGC